MVLEHIQLCEDPCKDGERGDGVGRPDEEEERPESDLGVIDEPVVDSLADGCSKGEWDDHSNRGDGCRCAVVGSEEGKVDLETDEEEEEDQSQCRDEVEVGEGCWGEDVCSESWDASWSVRVREERAVRGEGSLTKGGRSNNDSSDDL